MNLEGRSLKVCVVLDAVAIAGIAVPNGPPRTPLRIVLGRRRYSATVDSRSLLRCIAAIASSGPGGVSVVLQGRLEGDRILDAALTAEVKVPGAAAA